MKPSARSNASPVDPGSSRLGWMPWWRAIEPTTPQARTSSANDAAALRPVHDEAERRRRIAASACLPVAPTLALAADAVFRCTPSIQAVASRLQNGQATAEDAATLHAVIDQLNDGLQRCDQLALLTGHVQQLLAPASVAPRRVDLGQLTSWVCYSARAFLPDGLVITQRLAPLPPVRGDRAELQQALTDCLAQGAGGVGAPRSLDISGGHDRSFVWLDICASGSHPAASPGIPLESATEIFARHRGTLDIVRADDQTLALRVRLPVGH